MIFSLVGDVLISTAFLSYSGPFNQDFRLLLNKNWSKEMKNRKIPYTANLNVINMLVIPTTVSLVIIRIDRVLWSNLLIHRTSGQAVVVTTVLRC